MIETSLSSQLKTKLRPIHIKTESLVPINNKEATSEDIIKYLVQYNDFFHSVQDQIFKSDELKKIILDLDSRRRDPYSKRTREPKLNSPYFPTLDSVESMLAAMYVFEGSTMGGSIMTKMINAKLNQEDQLSDKNILNPYGPNAPQMWQTFKNYLDQYAEQSTAGTTERQKKILDSAEDTFLRFCKYLAN